MDFKQKFTFEERKKEADRIRLKFTDRVPIVCERASHCTDISSIDKKKYLVPYELTLGQFLYVIRKRIQLPASDALFVFVNNKLPPMSSYMYSIYEKNKDDDGFLYVTYATEATFG